MMQQDPIQSSLDRFSEAVRDLRHSVDGQGNRLTAIETSLAFMKAQIAELRANGHSNGGWQRYAPAGIAGSGAGVGVTFLLMQILDALSKQ